MKPTIRVSIGGLAFNIEEDAYHILDNYLGVLKKHFEANPEAGEIISDIEARLSELLQMRLSNLNNAVTIEDAQEIINRMGNPKDFGDETEISEQEKTNSGTIHANEKESTNFFKKKLYRDTEHRIIAGVCSGLGHYLRTDAVAIRILFIALLFLLNIISSKTGATVVVAYIILWIVMPKARTFSQKLEMSGSDPSIENIEDRNQTTTRKYRGGFFSDAVRIFFNIILGTIAVITFLILVTIIGTLGWLYFDTEVFGIRNYLFLVGFDTLNLQIAFVLALILPVIGLFCLTLKILRRTPFTSATLVQFLIGIVIWGGAIFYSSNKGIAFAREHRHEAKATDTISINTVSDTLYVTIADEYTDTNNQPNNTAIIYKGDNRKNKRMAVLPEVIVKEDTLLTSFKVEVNKKNFGKTEAIANKNVRNMSLNYAITDSLLVVKPKWYDRDNHWNMESYQLIITTPRNKKAIVKPPLSNYYEFEPVNIQYYDNCYFFNYDCNFD